MTATTRHAARRPWTALLLALAIAAPAVAVAGPTQAESSLAQEAHRQLEFARAEIEAGEYERAHKSAASALRLDPGLHEAMMLLGLALEGEGETIRAEALLRTYIELEGSESALPQAHEALARLTGDAPADAAPANPAETDRG